MKNKIYCFDIDGVICKTNGKNYSKAKPIKNSIKKIFTAKKRVKKKQFKCTTKINLIVQMNYSN